MALIIMAAALHASWHLLVKRAERRHLFTGWALAVGAVLYSPVLFLYGFADRSVWLYAFVSALVQAAYFLMLVRAYERADFSLVYPIARGAAPGLLALWGGLFLGERLRPAGIAGLACLLLGLVAVGGGLSPKRRPLNLKSREIVIALGVALCISVYSAIDGAVVRSTPVLPYLALVMVLTALFVTPFLFAHYGVRQAVACWRAQRARIILVGILPSLPYLLVLKVYAVSGVSYAGALREVSIVFAALAGWLLLGEPFGAMRAAGSFLIFAGIIVIALAR
ncbi:MAG TPA: DMT family transporter [Pyrinomonadaceae bacterium]